VRRAEPIEEPVLELVRRLDHDGERNRLHRESLEVQTFEADGILLSRQRERGTDSSRSFDNAIDVFLGKRMVIGERDGLGCGAARRH
jgi:hypothetical protein